MNSDERRDESENHQRFDKHVECLEEHLSKYFSDDEMRVFHEIVSFDFHLDVYFIKPANRAYNILLTSGMSSLPMTVDEGIDNPKRYEFAELMMLLPKDIDFGDVYPLNENSWIISMLKQSARIPHNSDTFLAIGHTIQATDDLQAYDEATEFVGCVILPSVTFDEDFTEIPCDGRIINIYSLFPLYRNELEYKLENGYDGLLNLLIRHNAQEVLDLRRKNLV